jgi:hypothetical protein
MIAKIYFIIIINLFTSLFFYGVSIAAEKNFWERLSSNYTPKNMLIGGLIGLGVAFFIRFFGKKK